MRKYALPTAILVLSLLALTLACRPADDDSAARLARLEADNAALATRVAGSDTAAADYAALADRLDIIPADDYDHHDFGGRTLGGLRFVAVPCCLAGAVAHEWVGNPLDSGTIA